MIRLLYAQVSRLMKNKLFWLGLLVMVGVPLYAVGVRYYDSVIAPETAWETADGLWFVGGIYMAVVLSVFVSLFIGTEFAEGTIRNKLIVGHTRSAIYVSNLITCSAVALFYHLVYIAVLFGAGSLLLKSWETPLRTLAILTVLSLAAVIALAALFTMLAMLISSRSAGAVTAMLVAMTMLIMAMSLFNRLNAQEYLDHVFALNEVGEYVKSDPIPNPKFLTGFKRDVYQHLLNLIPIGQMLQFGNLHYVTQMYFLPLYSIFLAVVCTIVGIVLFQKKNIR